MSRIYDEEEKQRHVDEYKASGLSKAEYAREHGVPSTTLGGWVKESNSISFGELTFEDDKTAKQPVVAKKPIIFGCENIRIELREGYDKEFLKKIVEVLTNVK